MGWLVGYTLASIATSFIAVKIFDKIVESISVAATGSVVGIARFGLFVLTWTAVTAQAGMHRFTRRVKKLRQITKAKGK